MGEGAENRQKLRRGLLRSAAPESPSLLLHRQLIGQRLYLYALARYLVVGAVAAGALFAPYAIGVRGLNVPALLGLAGLLAVYNTLIFLAARPHRTTTEDRQTTAYLERVMHLTITADFIFLTLALWLVGGAKSPFQAFYLFHVMLASVLLSRRAAFFYAAFAFALLAVLTVGQWRGWIPPNYPEGAVIPGPLEGRYVLTTLVVGGLLFLLTVVLLTSITKLLRQGERRLRVVNTRLETMAEMQRDFLHIALHNLKSPVAAMTYMMESLRGDLPELSEQQSHWFERAQTRLRELSAFLRDLELFSSLESGELAKHVQPVDIKALLERLVDEQRELAAMHRHTLVCDVPDGLPPVPGVERLLHEAVVNYLTNAFKYTPDGGTIRVTARDIAGAVRVEVADNGIGINREGIQKLFREFVRLKRADSPVGAVGGSGLGLSIVKRIAEMHGGRVDVQSNEGKGSTFALELPI